MAKDCQFCRECAYWKLFRRREHPEFALGFCRREPPTIDHQGNALHPVVLGSDWCGEFELARSQECNSPTLATI